MDAVESSNVEEMRLPRMLGDLFQRDDMDVARLDTSRPDPVQLVAGVYGKPLRLLDKRPVRKICEVPTGRSTGLNELLQLIGDFFH